MEKEKHSLDLKAHSNDLQDWFCAWYKIYNAFWQWEDGRYDGSLVRFFFPDIQYRLPLPCDSLIRLGLSHMGIEVEDIEYSSPFDCNLWIWFYGEGGIKEEQDAFEKVKRFFGKSIDVGPRPTEMW
jgi:hypothetical protein